MKIILDHIALVVNSVDQSIQKLKKYNFAIGEINEFPSEGTKEVYIANQHEYGRLLLMEPISAGPYQKALQQRGAGLHHIAINVESLEKYLDLLSGSGWYLHLHSFNSLKYDTVWLARANTPLLIEVHQLDQCSDEKLADLMIEKVVINSPISAHLLNSLQINELSLSEKSEAQLVIDGRTYNLLELFV